MMKKVRTAGSKVLALLLAVCMMISLVPVNTFAAGTTTEKTATETNVQKVLDYAVQMYDANSSKFGDVEHTRAESFSWDTEGKTDSWRYYNGVMMDAFMMADSFVSNDLKTNVEIFYNANIEDDGTITKYGTGHQLDSVAPARGLFKLLDNTLGNQKYEKAIQKVYTELEGQKSYSNCGGNYLHKDTWTTFQIGLDGLYMAQPFLMECAKAIEAGKLVLTNTDNTAVKPFDIYDAVEKRLAWVADAMYVESTKLYHHGWKAEGNEGNEVHWARGIGWYAMALVDIIEMMPSDKQTAMIANLEKLFDGMITYQDSSTGMWYNVVNEKGLSNNKLETSGSAMMAYALMKAYNNGWVDRSYGEAGLKAFNGVVTNEVETVNGNYKVNNVYKSSGVETNPANYCVSEKYVSDEAKGTGPLIMASTLATTAADKLAKETTDVEKPTEGSTEGTTEESTEVAPTEPPVDNIVSSKPENTDPYVGLDKAEEYPEYPADGAVRINKTATGMNFNNTGVAKIELDAAGISVKQGVDVVLVVDVSNSMGWTDNWFNNPGIDPRKAKDNVKVPTNGADDSTKPDKLDAAMNAAKEFTNILLKDNVEGNTKTNNSISFVTFAGYDKENIAKEDNWIDSVQTVFTNVQDAELAKSVFDNTKFTNYKWKTDDNGKVTGSVDYTLQIGQLNKANNTVSTVEGLNRGNTNYDYAFAEANKAVTVLKSGYTNYAGTGRQTIVVFMTDGAPSHYNNDRANGNATDYQYGTKTVYPSPYKEDGKTNKYTPSDWLGKIKQPNLYAESLNENVDDFYAVGFDLNHGGFTGFTTWNQNDLKHVLEGLAGENSIDVELAENNEALEAFYNSLANQMKLAGTNARVTDVIASPFTLQKTAFGTENTSATIDIIAYDLYTKVTAAEFNDIGKRTGTSTVIESVRFNEAGTEAYSNLLGENTNIMSVSGNNVTITGKYFTYVKSGEKETFTWEIGDITDKELALSYYAYLKNSVDSEVGCEKGMYPTNESAKLDYVDINGKHAVKTYRVPKLNWGGAATTFEFYLVNEKGEPVNHAGERIPFDNRIILNEQTVELNLNTQLQVEAKVIRAQDYLPTDYFLYDENASYTVRPRSGDELTGGIEIASPSSDAFKTTTVNGVSIDQTGAQTTILVSCEREYLTQSHVAFGIRWDLTPTYAEKALEKEQVVIDYGKDILIDVASNDTTIEGYVTELVGFAQYSSNVDLKRIMLSPGQNTYTTDNGEYSISEGKVKFQPKKMLSEVEKVFCVMKVTEEATIGAEHEKYYYLYEELNIIPATIMYYETDFAQNVFTFTDGTKAGTAWNVQGTPQSEMQDDGTIGVNQTYGYDNSYNDDSIYSNGSSYKVEGETDSSQKGMNRFKTTTSFNFTGTGFDLISRTGEQQGTIRLDIYTDSTMSTRLKSITVNNKSESQLELYQIPVVSVNGLTHGTYYVKIGVSAAYTDPNNDALSRGGEFYFDAIRIFDPINVEELTDDAKIANDAYIADGEAKAQNTEVRAILLDSTTYDSSVVSKDGIIFVDRGQSSVDVGTYKTIGPNNEVYLKSGQGITFKLLCNSYPASIDIGAKSADGVPANLTVRTGEKGGTVVELVNTTINTCTAQNYSLMTGTAELGNNSYITIYNNGSNGILSITDLKIAYGDTQGVEPAMAVFSVDSDAVAVACFMMDYVPIVEEPVPDIPEVVETDCDILSAKFTKDSVKERSTATLKIVSEADVETLTVVDADGDVMKINVKDCETNSEGNKEWKVAFKATKVGMQTFTVTGYDAEGNSGEAKTAEIKVRKK